MCSVSTYFVTKLPKIILLDAIQNTHYVINNYLDRQYISEYFPNSFLCT